MARNKSKKVETIQKNHLEDVCCVQKIHLYDGYVGEPIFKGFGNYSTYYNQQTDGQCRVPIRPMSEIKQELGL